MEVKLKIVLGEFRNYLSPAIIDSIKLFLASTFMNASNYVFHLIAIRTLDSSAYGNMALMFSFVVIVSYPAQFLQLLVARNVAISTYAGANENIIVKRFMQFVLRSTRYLLGPLLIFCLLAPFLLQIFNLESLEQVWITAIIFLTSLEFFSITGFFQGLEDFTKLSFLLFLIGFVKITSTILFIPLGLTTELALIAQIIGNVVALALGFYWLISKLNTTDKSPQIIKLQATVQKPHPNSHTNWHLLVSVSLYAALTNMDLVFVKILTPAEIAGEFAVVTVVGKLILFFPVAIATVVYPKLVKAYIGNQNFQELGLRSLITVATLTIIPVIIFNLFSQPLIELIFGEKYSIVSNIVGVYVTGMFAYSLVYLLMYYYIAIEDQSFAWLLGIITILQAIILLFVGGDVNLVVHMITVGGITTIVLSEVFCKGLIIRTLSIRINN